MKQFLIRIESAFPKDSISRMLLQFLLIGIVAQLWAFTLSYLNTQHLREIERFRLEVARRYEFTESFAVRSQRRMYLMSVVVWELTLHNSLSDSRQTALQVRYEEYRQELIEWNAMFQYHLIAMSRHFSERPSELSRISANYALFTSELAPLISPPPAQQLRTTHGDTLLRPVDEYIKPGRQLSELAILLQSDFQAVHGILKRCVDRRLADGLEPDSTDLAVLAVVRPELARRVHHYSELLFRLASAHDRE